MSSYGNSISLHKVLFIAISVTGLVELFPSITSKRWLRSTFLLGEYNVKQNLLVDMNKMSLSLLHMKLCLMKDFVKAMNANDNAFQHLSTMYSSLLASKISKYIFIRPQLLDMLKNTKFEEPLALKDLRAGEAI